MSFVRVGNLFGQPLPILKLMVTVPAQGIHPGVVLRKIPNVKQGCTRCRPFPSLVTAHAVGILQLCPHRRDRFHRQALQFFLDVAALAGIGAQLSQPHQIALPQLRTELGVVLDLDEQRLAVSSVAALLTKRHQCLNDLRMIPVVGINGTCLLQFRNRLEVPLTILCVQQTQPKVRLGLIGTIVGFKVFLQFCRRRLQVIGLEVQHPKLKA